MGRVTARRPAVRLDGEHRSNRPDTLAVEEPLEIRVAGRVMTVTMRTPGDDFDLASGFLASAGVIHRIDDIAEMRYCAGVDEDGANTYNVLDLAVPEGVPPPDTSVDRTVPTTGPCGLGGKSAIDATQAKAPYEVGTDPVMLSPETLAGLSDTARSAGRVFPRTGGGHVAGVFTGTGDLVCLREDVDRHNAEDKVIGWALREHRLPLSGHVLFANGRASFEVTRKALHAGMPALTAVSAPSSLAVDLAGENGMTLVGFLDGAHMTVYTGAHRVGQPSRFGVGPRG